MGPLAKQTPAWLDQSASTLRGAIRALRRSPGYAIAVIASLALCLGLNTALFSVTFRLLVNPLPYPNSRQLLAVGIRYSDTPGGPISTTPEWEVPFPGVETLAQSNRLIDGMFTFSRTQRTIVGRAAPEYAEGAMVAGNLPRVLGVRPLLGRWFSPTDANSQLVVLAYSLWRRQFEGDSNVVGQTLNIANEPWTIIGVMPKDAAYPLNAQYWTPVRQLQEPEIVLKRAAGVSLQQVSNVLSGALPSIGNSPQTGYAVELSVITLRDRLFGSTGAEFRLLALAALALFLIGCANVASLTTARAFERQPAFAIRRALGARQARLRAMVIAECGILALAGCGLALLLARWALAAAPSVVSPDLLSHVSLALSWSSVAFAFVLAVVALAIVSAGPLAAMSWLTRGTPSAAARETTPWHARRWYRFLTVAQFALAFVLLVGSLTLIRTLVRLAAPSHLGFSPGHVIVATVPLPWNEYPAADQRRAFVRTLEQRIAQLPGIERVASGPPPLVGGRGNMVQEGFSSMFLHGNPEDPNGVSVTVWVSNIDAGYFPLYSIALLQGRDFTIADNENAPPVAILNAAAAHAFFGSANPIGRPLPPDAPKSAGGQPVEVVGVVGDMLQQDPTIPAAPQVFLPTAQQFAMTPTPTIAVRVRGTPTVMIASVRDALHTLDPRLASSRLQPMESVIDQALSRQSAASRLLAVFAALATCLAVLGLYSVLSYFVARKMKDFGIRLALGAQRHDIVRLVLGETGGMTGVALVLGAGLVWIANRILVAAAFGSDQITIPIVAAVGSGLSAIALLAALAPSLRASRSDPVAALHAE